jgi:FkbM family methyltransferase
MHRSDELHSLLVPQRQTAVVDIGASDLGETPPYQPLLALGLATLIGFEPQRELCEKLNAAKGPLQNYLPYAVGDGGRHTFYRTRYPGMSGLKKPNARRLDQFIPLAEWGTIIGETEIQTHRLDEIVEVSTIDFLKIDVEGSELDVFRAGRQKLSQAVVVWTEVSFVPIYDDQALLGDVDVELRSLGFLPQCIKGIFNRMIAPMLPVGQNMSMNGFQQTHAVDMIYCRDFGKMEVMTDEQLKHLALISHHCLDGYDLAFRSVVELVKRGTLPDAVRDQYIDLIKREVNRKMSRQMPHDLIRYRLASD